MSEIIEKETTKQALKPPTLWNVLLINDDFTTMEFVMGCLMGIFGKTAEEAYQITMDVHHKGRGLAGTYSKDIAMTKQAQVEEYARQEEHPFKAEIEPNE